MDSHICNIRCCNADVKIFVKVFSEMLFRRGRGSDECFQQFPANILYT
jgi:hypothetical protein